MSFDLCVNLVGVYGHKTQISLQLESFKLKSSHSWPVGAQWLPWFAEGQSTGVTL